MKNWFKTVISALVACSLALSPTAPALAGGPASFPLHARIYRSSSIFPEQAVVPPISGFIHPFYSRIKISSSRLFAGAQVLTGHVMIQWGAVLMPWLILLPALQNLPASVGYAILTPRLETMQSLFKKIQPEHDVWASVKSFLRTYFGSPIGRSSGMSSEEWSLSLDMEATDREFLRWLEEEKTRDPSWRVPAAILDIQLQAIPYPGLVKDTQGAFDQLKAAHARRELLDVARRSGMDYVSIAAALDALQELDAHEELQEYVMDHRFARLLPSSSPGPKRAWGQEAKVTLDEIAVLPRTLPIMARLGVADMNLFFNHQPALEVLRARLRLPDLKTAQTVFRLLALEDVPRRQSVELLSALVDENDLKKSETVEGMERFPGLADVDLYAMIGMLAVLQLMRKSGAGRVSLTPERVRALQKEITRTHWSAPEYDFQRSVTIGKLAGRLGEIVHRDLPDPAVKIFMGFLFEMVFRQSMSSGKPELLRHPAIHDEDIIAAARHRGAEVPKAGNAARIQFSVLGRAATQPKAPVFRWDQVYKYAQWYLSKPDWSVSLLARDILLTFTRQPTHQTLNARLREIDQEKNAWLVAIPESMAPASGHEEDTLFPQLDEEPETRSEAELLQTWEERIVRALYSRQHYNDAKNRVVYHEWDNWVRLIYNQPQIKPIPPYLLEMDPTHICNNDCGFCRLISREVPDVEVWIDGEDMVRIAEEAREMNPLLSMRTSGVIGEPTMNRGTVKVIKKFNELGMHHGFTTNGLLMTDEMLEALISAEAMTDFVSSSVDAGSNETYEGLKHPKGEFRDRPFDRVIDTLRRLVQRRRETGSKTGIYVSFLVQEANYPELESLVPLLKLIGVDGIQIKFQHYDPNRHMQPESIRYVFDRREALQAYSDEQFQVVFVQDEGLAHKKNTGQPNVNHLKLLRDGKPIQISSDPEVSMISKAVKHCIVQFAAPAVAATGMGHPCCESYLRKGETRIRTLPIIGNAVKDGVKIFLKDQRARFRMNPHKYCRECSPSDRFLNEVFAFMQAAAAYPGLLAKMYRILHNRHQWAERLAWEEAEGLLPDNVMDEEPGDEAGFAYLQLLVGLTGISVLAGMSAMAMAHIWPAHLTQTSLAAMAALAWVPGWSKARLFYQAA